MIRTLTCIGCPMGCSIDVELDENGNYLSSKGWSCLIGKRYAQEEVTAPVRTVTALVEVANREEPLSVKTSRPIPKGKIFECLSELKTVKAKAPIKIGDVILPNTCATGIDVIATKNIL